MPHRLILKVTKFQLPPPKRLGTVVKNILGAIMAPPCQIGLNIVTNLGAATLTDREIEIHKVKLSHPLYIKMARSTCS